MLRCDTVPERLLERRYGLLDPAEAATLDAHLASCPTCTAAPAAADRTATLFARAAVLPFPDVTFVPPVEATVSTARPAARAGWAPWMVAAAVLLALGGPTVNGLLQHQTARERVTREVARLDQVRADRDALTAKRADAGKTAAAARDEFDRVTADWVNATVQAKSRRPLGIEVTGPPAAVPGATSEYRIRTTDANGQPIALPVEVAVRDRAGTEYLRDRLPPAVGKEAVDAPPPIRFKLSPGVWAKLPPGGDLFLSVSAVDPASQAKVELAEPVKLTAPVYATFLTTDKPLYRPGEVLYFRAVTLDRTRFRPPADDRVLRVELRKPDGGPLSSVTATARPVDAAGRPILGPDGQPVRGVSCGAFPLPNDLPGGEYTLAAFELPAGWDKPEPPADLPPLAVRKLVVNTYSPDKLHKTLEFDRASHARGEPVRATLTVTDQGRPVPGVRVIPNVTVQPPNLIDVPPVTTDAAGQAVIAFPLPDTPDLSDVTLAVEVRKDGTVETISRRVPLASAKLTVELFPEGGQLTAGVPNRVYLRVTTAAGRPADLTGTVTDGTSPVAEFRTLSDADRPGANQGLGVFTFTPRIGKTYTLAPARPAGATLEIKEELTARPDAVGLSVPTGVLDPAAAVPVRVASAGRKRELIVGAYTRGVSLGHRKLSVEADRTADTAITPPAGTPGGVTRVTVFEIVPGVREPVPVAERLVFRRPPHALALAVTAAAGPFAPGGDVQLSLTAKDETGQPAAAVLWVAVVNESVLTLADDKTERSLPTHFLLATEVRKPEQLEHADFFLTDHPTAVESLDLLLGTQGWRRFAEQTDLNLLRAQPPSVDRKDLESLLILAGARAAERADPVAAAHEPRYAAAEAKLLAAEAEEAKLRTAEPPTLDSTALHRAADDRTATADHLRRFTGPAAAVGVVGLVLVIFGRRAWRWLGAGLLVVAVGLLLVVLPAWTTHAPLFENVMVTGAVRPDAAPVPEAAAPWANENDLREVEGGIRRPRGVMAFAAGPKPDARFDPRPRPNALPRELADRLAADLHDLDAYREVRDALARRLDTEYRRGRVLQPVEREGLEQVKKAIIGPGPFVAREYAHTHSPAGDDATRTDFTETVLWQPVLVLPDGTGSVRFQLSDSLHSYRVLAAGHTLDGRLGSVTTRLTVRQPLAVDVKLPAEISTADKPRLPVMVSNGTPTAADTVLSVWSDQLRYADEPVRLNVAPMGGDRRLMSLTPTRPGPARVRVSATASGGRADAVERTITVVPDGFPVSGAVNEVLETTATLKLVPPADPVPGTVSAKLTVFTNALADVRGGLDGLLREPHGCFEQTSSANYPNVLVLNYLSRTGTVNPAAADKARELLDRGQQRLASFEVPREKAGGREGFDWFGRFPPHPPLSAYGLVQFADAARVTKVDPELIARTRDYLLGCRDGQGGFRRPTDGHTFGSAPDRVCNAYIAWAITEADATADVAREVEAAAAEAMTSGDPYRLALAAAARRNRDQPADDLLAKLAEQQNDGGLTGAEATITRSAGADLDTETTALAALAFLKGPTPNRYEANARAAVRWLAARRGPGGAFGATQATVLALKALTEFARQNHRPPEAGTLRVSVNGTEVAARPFRTDDPEPVTIALPAGVPNEAATVTLTTNAKAAYPVSLTWTGFSRRPASDPNCPLTLTTALDKPSYREGETGRVSVTLTNTAATDQGMTVAVVGLPAGLTVPVDLKQPRALADAGTVSHFEVTGREVVFYWRGLGPKQTIAFTFDVHAAVPGEYRGPAGRAYLYYAPAARVWVPPLTASIGE